MIKCQISFGVLIASLILLTGFKKNIGQQNISSTKSVHTYNGVGIFSEPVKVSIAGASVIQGDKGERPVKAMVYLSRAVSEPVTVEYSTKNAPTRKMAFAPGPKVTVNNRDKVSTIAYPSGTCPCS